MRLSPTDTNLRLFNDMILKPVFQLSTISGQRFFFLILFLNNLTTSFVEHDCVPVALTRDMQQEEMVRTFKFNPANRGKKNLFTF